MCAHLYDRSIDRRHRRRDGISCEAHTKCSGAQHTHLINLLHRVKEHTRHTTHEAHAAHAAITGEKFTVANSNCAQLDDKTGTPHGHLTSTRAVSAHGHGHRKNPLSSCELRARERDKMLPNTLRGESTSVKCYVCMHVLA